MASNGDEIHAAIAGLQRLAEAFGVRRAQLAAEVGLTDHQWGVLEEIATEHFMPSMFARRRHSSAAAVSKTLRQLHEKGLIAAQVAKGDARQRAYGLTPTGVQVMSRLRKSRQKAIADIWADLDGHELKTFSRFSQQLADRLERYAERIGNEEQNGKDAVRKSV
ncbi:MAG: MarR family transcriptional regulator [Myxococcales bacterium]|nr:MarR family transcriptional regulator [Myxococcales bacterium]